MPRPSFIAMWENAKEYRNIYGILLTSGDDLKALEKAMRFEEEDATGAMHQCVMGHLRFIHEHSLEEWRNELIKHRSKDALITWTGEI